MNLFEQQLSESLSTVNIHKELDQQFHNVLSGSKGFDPIKLYMSSFQDDVFLEGYDQNILKQIMKSFNDRYKNYPKDRANTQSEYKSQMARYYNSLSEPEKSQMAQDLKDIKSSMGRDYQQTNLSKLVKQYKDIYKSNLYKMTKKMVDGGLFGGGLNTKTPQGRNVQKVILSLYDKVSRSIDSWSPTLAEPGAQDTYQPTRSSYYNK